MGSENEARSACAPRAGDGQCSRYAVFQLIPWPSRPITVDSQSHA